MHAAAAASERAIELWNEVAGFRDVRMGPMIWLVHSEVLLQSGDASAAREWAEKALAARGTYDDPSSPSIAQARAAVERAIAAKKNR